MKCIMLEKMERALWSQGTFSQVVIAIQDIFFSDCFLVSSNTCKDF